MYKSPLLSVVIPMYNAEKYLSKCIDSILNQSFKDIEVVLVNDGSTDQSEIIALNYVGQYPFIRYFAQQNAGAARARYAGVQRASADYITFVDADDTLTSDALEVFSHELMSSNYAYDIIIANNQNLTYSEKELQQKILVEETICGPCSKLYKKDLFSEFAFNVPREIKVGEDLLMNLRCLKDIKSLKIKELNKVVYKYNRNQGSLTSSLIKTMEYESCFYQELLLSLTDEDQQRLHKELIQSRLRGLQHVCLCTNGNLDKQAPYYQQLIQDIKTYNYTVSFDERVLLYATSFFKVVFYARLLQKKILKKLINQN